MYHPTVHRRNTPVLYVNQPKELVNTPADLCGLPGSGAGDSARCVLYSIIATFQLVFSSGDLF